MHSAAAPYMATRRAVPTPRDHAQERPRRRASTPDWPTARTAGPHTAAYRTAEQAAAAAMQAPYRATGATFAAGRQRLQQTGATVQPGCWAAEHARGGGAAATR